ncbi:alpha/beta hydrolase fold domain-containing protein [Tundrisphaera sp. TA3]|uniref:alpha/beta hydrolase fold domain-containing protein n=1 Tax=Tundrisphaera sp. TA3 TaxID=3435775 RepID=UPI003EB6A4AE
MHAPHRRNQFRPAPIDGLEPRSLLSIASPGQIASIRRGPDGRSFPDLIYSGRQGRALRLDLMLPAGDAPVGGWSVILAFPGAGWRSVNRKLLTPEVASFGKSGYAVAVVDVSYAGTQVGTHIWPRNLNDARNAVRWVRANASRFGVNPGQIVAFGESAGANLALLLGNPSDPAGSSGDASVQAVVDLYGPTDLVPLFRQPKARDKLLTFLGGPPDRVPGRYAAASPLGFVSNRSAPTFIAHGTEDATVPQDQSIRLGRALDAAGVANRLVLLPGYGHGFQPNRGDLKLIPQIVGFLDSVLPGRAAIPAATAP